MTIWSAEIKELETLYTSIKGKFPELEKELERLIKADDENMVLLYSRRCLEVIITDLCESELKRPRKTEPLKGIIDKLSHEEKVPSHIIASMQNLNTLSTFGAHPKEFDPQQVRPVLINLTTIIQWYLKYKTQKIEVTEKDKEEKHEPEKPGKEKEPIPVAKAKNKSVLIISGLLIIGVIIIFSLDIFNIFHKDKFEDIRDPEGKISIAVMPFQNMTNDTLWNVWQGGIQNELITNLSNSEELSVRQYQTMYEILQGIENINYASITPLIAGDISRKLEANTFILGSIKESGSVVRINAQLINSKTEEIYKTYQINGKTEDDIFIITDSLSRLIRDYLEIEALKQKANDEIQKTVLTASPEAFRLYLNAWETFLSENYLKAIPMFEEIIRIDSGFYEAYSMLSIAYNNISINYEKLSVPSYNMDLFQKAKDVFNTVYKYIDNMPYGQQTYIHYWKAHLDKRQEDNIRYAQQVVEINPNSRSLWYELGYEYERINQLEKAIAAYEKVMEISNIWGSDFKWVHFYLDLGTCYHKLGYHDKEKAILELGLGVIPDHPSLISQQAICALSQNKTLEANELIKKYQTLVELESIPLNEINLLTGSIYYYGEDLGKAEEFYRESLSLKPNDIPTIVRLAWLLINHDINLKEGMELITHGLELEPENANLLKVQGWGLYKKGKYDEALNTLKRAENNYPIYFHDIHVMINEVQQALAN